MSTAPAKPLWAQATAFLLFAAGNIGLNFFNSWALKSTDEEGTWAKPSFDFPIFYTMFHQLVSGSVAFLLATCVVKAEGGGPNFAQYWEYKFVILPIALCSALNTGLNNMSLSMVSLFVNQTIKAMQPLPTTFFSWALAGKKYTIWVCLVVTIVVVGNIMALWHQISGSDDGDKTSVVGIVLCILALFSTCIRPVIMMIVMDGQTRPKLSPTTVLTYDSLSAFCMMFIYWIVSPERAGSIGYLSDPNTGKIGFTIIIVGSLVAFVFNLSIYYFVQLTSALTSVIGSNLIKIFLLIVTAIQAQVVDPTSWTGIAIVVSSIAVYAYMSFAGLMHPLPEQQPLLTVEKGKATEATPLRAP